MKVFLLLFTIIIASYSKNLFEPLPINITYDKNKVELGKKLFFDPILSRDKDISCASCHAIYGADDKQFSIGTDEKKGFINTPSIFNLPYKIAYFWNGRSDNLYTQMTDGPLFNKHEMASNKEMIEERLLRSKRYLELFQTAYKTKPTFELMLDAIVAFQKTLISLNSKFDKYLRKEVELSPKEKKGMELFVSYGCVSCHNGINIGGNSYQKFGAVIEFEGNSETWPDRYAVTNDIEDKMVFIVPSLRNVEKTTPYFHSGKIKTLKEAILLMGYNNVAIAFTEEEVELIEEFLKTLTGEIPKTFKKVK